MNIVIWVLAGSVFGWIGYSFFQYNLERGMMISVIIGGAGGFAGGKLSESLFDAAAGAPGAFSMPALLLAATVAATVLFVANTVEKRWGI
jgi:uncharacterized membrane protein YeaQ/YmgE (transglycosylase-associated protein family)